MILGIEKKLKHHFTEDFYDSLARDGEKHYDGIGTIRRDKLTRVWTIEASPIADREIERREARLK